MEPEPEPGAVDLEAGYGFVLTEKGTGGDLMVYNVERNGTVNDITKAELGEVDEDRGGRKLDF